MFFKPPAHYKIFGKLRATNWEAEYHHENEHLTEIFLNVHENIYELWNIFIILLLFGILPILRISRPCLKSEVLHFMAPRGQSSFIVGADLYARFWYPLKYSIFRNMCTNDNWNIWCFSNHTGRRIRSTVLLVSIWKFCRNWSFPETPWQGLCKSNLCWIFSTNPSPNHNLSLSMGKAKEQRRCLKLWKVSKIHDLKIPVNSAGPVTSSASHSAWMFPFPMEWDMTSKVKSRMR